MAYSFSLRSLDALDSCDENLRMIAFKAIDLQVMDFIVLQGHRGEKEQNDYYRRGLSKTPWPKSKHNQTPSIAMDVAPYPIDWKDSLAFARLAGMLCAIGAEIGHPLRWGGDWDGDGQSNDQRFMDLGHFELRQTT